jgi:CubicO group peptidase (beta-lactamase class C family)
MQIRNFLIVFCFTSLHVSAQILPDSTIRKIDQIFEKWPGNNGPGYTIGIVRNDSLIYAKGYGMANLEYAIPNKPETIYHMASVSKQFTAYCIMLLEQEGKLKLDDDVRKYLPWFPDLQKKITILHLLNHTSGIRDQWDLVVMSGTRMEDVITQEQIIQLLTRQQALNFDPGAEYSYSNSNFSMLAEIVKNVSGKSFRQFVDDVIFKPLGMKDSHIHDNYMEVVINRAYSYRPLDNVHFANSILNYSNAGATSLFTNIPDMAKWVINFYDPKVGNVETIKKLTTKGILNNGEKISYAAGIAVDEYNGKLRFSHNGADAGYRTAVSVFPDEKLGVIVFSNLSNANPAAKAGEITDLFIKPLPKTAVTVQKKLDSGLARIADTLSVVKYMGNYISDEAVRFSYKLNGQQLFWISPGGSFLLAKTQNDTMVMLSNPDVKFLFSTNSKKDTIVDQYWTGNHRKLVKFNLPTTDPVQLDKELKEYTGTYYSPELDTKFSWTLEKHKLKVTNNKSVNLVLDYIQRDRFASGAYFVNFKRDAADQISGYEISTGRVRHLVFTKMGL